MKSPSPTVVRGSRASVRGFAVARRSRWARGFTLIEMVFTILIISLIMGLGFLSISSVFAERELVEPATEVRLAAKRALRSAIVEQRSYSIVINATSFLLRPGVPPPNAERPDDGLEELRNRGGGGGEVTNFVLDDGIQFRVRPYNAEDFVVPKNFVWTFNQSGLCDPISVQLVKGDDYLEMKFNPISGNVESESTSITGN